MKALVGKEERVELQRKTLSVEGKKQDGSYCGSETVMKGRKEIRHAGMSLKWEKSTWSQE